MMEEPNASLSNDRKFDDNTLFNMAYLAKVFSYVVITAGTVNLFMAVGKFYFSDIFRFFWGKISLDTINLIGPQLLDFVMAGVYFIILQVVSGILFNMIDIKELSENRDK